MLFRSIKIKKDRTSFTGIHHGQALHIDMDSIKYDHSPAMRYFIEAEVLSKDKEGISELKASLILFLKESLGTSEIKESPGMFMMAYEKR